MRNLRLTVWDRVQLVGCIPQQDTIDNVRKHIRFLDNLELTDKERKSVGMVATTDGGLQWKNTTRLYDIELEDADFEHLMELVAAREQWPTTRATDALHRKLEKYGE